MTKATVRRPTNDGRSTAAVKAAWRAGRRRARAQPEMRRIAVLIAARQASSGGYAGTLLVDPEEMWATRLVPYWHRAWHTAPTAACPRLVPSWLRAGGGRGCGVEPSASEHGARGGWDHPRVEGRTVGSPGKVVSYGMAQNETSVVGAVEARRWGSRFLGVCRKLCGNNWVEHMYGKIKTHMRWATMDAVGMLAAG